MINFFIRRPIFAMVISIIVVILGLLSIRSLPVEQYPDITPPNVEVSASYQGADAVTVDEAVATPVGQSIMGVSDMLYLQTTSASDGTMALTATFAVDSDPDMNAVFTQNRVATATPMLPSEVRQQGLTTVKSMSGYLMVFAIYSDGRYDDNFLANYAYINIQNEVLKSGQGADHGFGRVFDAYLDQARCIGLSGCFAERHNLGHRGAERGFPGREAGRRTQPPGYGVHLYRHHAAADQFGRGV